MKPCFRNPRWMAGLLVAAVLMATLAPAAQAEHRRWKRHKHYRPAYTSHVVTHYYHPGSVYVVRRSDAGPAIAGFLGGLFLGATLAHAAPAGFVYYDPYCHREFVTLEVYRTHLRRHGHPRIVRVIEVESGHCVDTWHYQDGRWREWRERDWDDD